MRWQKNLWAMSTGVLVASVSFTLFTPFYPDYFRELGVTDNLSIWTGIAISLSFLASGAMAPVWGSLADRYGKRIMVARSGYGMAVIMILTGLAASHWQFLFYRILNGLLAGFIPAAIMLTVSNTPRQKMGYALGILNTSVALGNIMGPFIGGALAQYVGIRMSIFLGAALLLGGTTLSFFGTKEKVVRPAERTTIVQDVKIVLGNPSLQVYFLCMVVFQMVIFIFMTTLPLRITELITTNTQLVIGILFSLTGLAVALGSPLVSRITRLSYDKLLLGGLLFSGALCVVQGITASIIILGLARLLFGFSNAFINVSGNVLITESSEKAMRGRVFGVLNAFTNFGAVIAPLIGGITGEHLGYASSFHGCAALFFLAGFVLWRFKFTGVSRVNAEG